MCWDPRAWENWLHGIPQYSPSSPVASGSRRDEISCLLRGFLFYLKFYRFDSETQLIQI